MIISQIIYRHFLKFVELKTNSFTLNSHETHFKCNDNTDYYYQEYYSIKEPTPPLYDTTCDSCQDHFLNNQPNIAHAEDIKRGIDIELSFMDYLNFIFEKRKLELVCQKADVKFKNMPDLKVIDKFNNEVICYIEMKSIFKPFIKINKFMGNDYYCNSNSLTLDSDQKLDKQFELIESEGIQHQTIYVYWYDIPCLKGIFWSSYEHVIGCRESQGFYERNTVIGDYNGSKKSGHTQKIYLNIKNMNDLESLILYVSNNKIIPTLKINNYLEIDKCHF
ncbi:TPA: hypothetical protein ACPY6L_003210 [Yersinia enterocolitica]